MIQSVSHRRNTLSIPQSEIMFRYSPTDDNGDTFAAIRVAGVGSSAVNGDYYRLSAIRYDGTNGFHIDYTGNRWRIRDGSNGDYYQTASVVGLPVTGPYTAITNGVNPSPTITNLPYSLPTTATFTRASVANFYDSDMIVRNLPASILRDSNYVGGVRETLLEPARTNILTSRAMNATPWAASNLNISAFSTTDTPVWGQSSYRIYGTGNAAHNVNLASSGVNGVVYTISIFAKADGENSMQLVGTNAGFGADVWANFVLTGSGSIGSTGISTSNIRIESLPNNWYRCSFTATSTSSAPGIAVYTNNGDSNALRAPVYTGLSSTTGILLCGPQIEAGDFAGAYIYRPDGTTATAARLADVLSFPFNYAPTDSTMYFRGRYYGRSATDNRIITLGATDGAAGTDAWLMGAGAGTPLISFSTRTNAGSYVTVAPAVSDITNKTFEACASLIPGVSLYAEGSVDGGTIVSASGSAAAMTFGYGGSLFLSSRAAGAAHTAIGVRDLIIVKGIRDMAWFRARV